MSETLRDRRFMRQVLEDALEKAATDPEFGWLERMPSEFYNPDFTKELARYIRNSLENAGYKIEVTAYALGSKEVRLKETG